MWDDALPFKTTSDVYLSVRNHPAGSQSSYLIPSEIQMDNLHYLLNKQRFLLFGDARVRKTWWALRQDALGDKYCPKRFCNT